MNSHTPCAVERRFYQIEIEHGLKLLAVYLREGTASVLAGLPRETVRAFFLQHLAPVNKLGAALDSNIDPECLLDGASEEFAARYRERLKNKAELRKASDRESLLTACLDERMGEAEGRDLEELYRVWITDYTDLSTAFKLLLYMPPDMRRKMNDREIFRGGNAMFDALRACIAQRNVYMGHDNEAFRSELTAERFLKDLSVQQDVLENVVFEGEGETRAAQAVRGHYELCAQRTQMPPLTFDELERQIPGFRAAVLRNSKMAQDVEDDVLYLHAPGEVAALFEEMSRIFRESAERMAAETGEPPAKQARSDAPIAPADVRPEALRTLAGYSSGALELAQLREVLTSGYVLADTSFWMDTALRETMLNRIAPMCTDGARRRLVIDWATRVELYQREKNLAGMVSDELQMQARHARTRISHAHHVGTVLYLPRTEGFDTTHTSIMNIAAKNPARWFCVFTESAEFVRELHRAGIRNILAARLLENGEVSLWPQPEEKPAAPAPAQPEPRPAAAPAVTVAAQPATVFAPTPAPITTPAPAPAGTCIPETNVLLRTANLPVEGSAVYTSDGGTVTLVSRIAEGGEGAVYATSREGSVAKIYHDTHRTQNRRDKLALMLNSDPHIPELCWPTDLLTDAHGVFVGFLMPELPASYVEIGRNVFMLTHESVCSTIMKGWDRLPLVQLAIDLCTVFQKMHRAGVLMGDINPRNIMLDPAARTFRIVDCDSVQIGGYPNPVGTEIFTSPDIYVRCKTQTPQYGSFLRTEQDEDYAVAVLLFCMLMLGQHPFAGKGITDVKRAMCEHNFVFRLKGEDGAESVSGADTPDGPFRLMWNNIPSAVKNLFGSVFLQGKQVGLGEWIAALEQYLHEMRAGRFPADLEPELYWDRDGTMCVPFTCERCGKATNLPKEQYARAKENNDFLLCSSCRTVAMHMKRRKVTYSKPCAYCEKPFQITAYKQMMIEEGRDTRPPACSDCLTQTTVVCSSCGKSFRTAKFVIDREKRRGHALLCKVCRSARFQ